MAVPLIAPHGRGGVGSQALTMQTLGTYQHSPRICNARRRGTVVVEVALISALIGIAAMTFGNWKPFKRFEKGPPVEQVTKLQQDLDKAKADLAESKANLADAQARERAAAEAERALKDMQLRQAQQMQSGAIESLDRQPVEHRTEQTKLATSLLKRSELALALAIGRLPPDQQAEILRIVDKALSDVAADRDEAQRLLKLKDEELKVITKERDGLKQELPKLAAKVEAAEAKVDAAEAKVATKDKEVKVAVTKLSVWATLKDRADRQASSLAGQFDALVNGLLWLAGLYVFIVYLLPGIVKHMQSGPLKNILRNISGYAANPLLYHDAKKKLAEATKQ